MLATSCFGCWSFLFIIEYPICIDISYLFFCSTVQFSIFSSHLLYQFHFRSQNKECRPKTKAKMSTTPTTPEEKLESQQCESVNEVQIFHHPRQISILINKQSQSQTSISEAHRQYIIERHGTDQLDPFPDYSDADPYNWPRSKKWLNLAFVAFHGFMSTFTAGAIQSAFENIARDLHVSLQQASYLVSLVIAIIGVAPFFWMPLADRFGRRPILLWSLIISLVANVGCAKSPSYATMAICRAIVAIGASPAAAIGAGMVQEVFFKHQRGRYMGIWTVFVTLGVPIGPLIFGFVAFRAGYRWIYWVLAIVSLWLIEPSLHVWLFGLASER